MGVIKTLRLIAVLLLVTLVGLPCLILQVLFQLGADVASVFVEVALAWSEEFRG